MTQNINSAAQFSPSTTLQDKSKPQSSVLLLCENEKSAQIDRRAIKEAGYNQIKLLTSGIEAANLLAGKSGDMDLLPNIIVCAQRLEDMDGEQFCAIIRQHPLLLGFPILLILANDNEAEQLRTLGCGASALLGRPYTISALKEKLDKLNKNFPIAETLKKAANRVDTKAFDEALQTYGVLLKHDRDPEDYFKVGMSCLEQRRWNLAINAFEHALRHAQVKAEAELGIAAAYKGKGDMEKCKAWLGKAVVTFVAARRWHHARAAYAKLLKHDPEAKNPFISEAHRLIRQRDYNGAASVLAEGAELTPVEQASNKYAKLCFIADDPDAMLKALENNFSQDNKFKDKKFNMDFLGIEIRQSLNELVKERNERQKLMSLERKWQLSQTMAERERSETAKAKANKPENKIVDNKSKKYKTMGIEVAEGKSALLFGEEEFPDDEIIDDEGINQRDNEIESVLAPLEENEATSELFESKPKLNEFLSVMKLTWKLAKRSKGKK